MKTAIRNLRVAVFSGRATYSSAPSQVHLVNHAA